MRRIAQIADIWKQTKMANYSDKHIAECIAYLNYSCKEGYLDEEVAKDIIRRKAWKEVYDMMDRGDAYANDNERD